MRKLFFVISVVGSVFFMTACGLNEEENITPSIDEMVVAPASTDSPSPPRNYAGRDARKCPCTNAVLPRKIR